METWFKYSKLEPFEHLSSQALSGILWKGQLWCIPRRLPVVVERGCSRTFETIACWKRKSFRERANVVEIGFWKIGHLRSLAVTCSRRSLAVTCGHLPLAVTCGHLGGHLRSLTLGGHCGGHLRSLGSSAWAVTCGHLLPVVTSAITCGHFGGHLWAEPSDCIYGLVFHVGESLGILSLGKFLIFSRPALGKYPTFSRP